MRHSPAPRLTSRARAIGRRRFVADVLARWSPEDVRNGDRTVFGPVVTDRVDGTPGCRCFSLSQTAAVSCETNRSPRCPLGLRSLRRMVGRLFFGRCVRSLVGKLGSECLFMKKSMHGCRRSSFFQLSVRPRWRRFQQGTASTDVGRRVRTDDRCPLASKWPGGGDRRAAKSNGFPSQRIASLDGHGPGDPRRWRPLRCDSARLVLQDNMKSGSPKPHCRSKLGTRRQSIGVDRVSGRGCLEPIGDARNSPSSGPDSKTHRPRKNNPTPSRDRSAVRIRCILAN